MGVVVLSDRSISSGRVSVSALIACGGVHHHQVQHKKHSKVVLVVETGEAREVLHFCVLVGYGADAIYPYLAMGAIYKIDWECL